MKTLRRIDVVDFLPRTILTSIFVSLTLLIAPMTSAQTFDEIRSAAQQGDMAAQHNLGLIYDTGRGVPENDAEAVKWYKLAAQQGYMGAQYNLGLMYANGEGVPKNFVKAYSWNSIASAQGYAPADALKSLLKEAMSPEQMAEAQSLSSRCFASDYELCD
ncbi:MAG: sel1 repeat family protein [Parvularculaceae bacterium]|nr:sel1 repeat family protein [Parvularculaceae bacterium]